MTITPWLRRHPLTVYFASAFGISWGGILVVMAVAGFNLSPMQPAEAGFIFLAMALGPSVSGLIVTVVLERRQGLRQLFARLVHWRVGARWYGLALLTAPGLLLTIMGLLGALVDPAFAPRFQWWLFAVGILAGSFEEIGWTGFATPRLLVRYRPWLAGLALGLIWAFWHLLVDFRYNFGAMGPAWLLEFAIVYLATLTPYRMLMTWVYSHTQCLVLAIVMHASLTGWLLVLFPSTSPTQGLFWQSLFALALWVAVAAVWQWSAAPTGRRQMPQTNVDNDRQRLRRP